MKTIQTITTTKIANFKATSSHKCKAFLLHDDIV